MPSNKLGPLCRNSKDEVFTLHSQFYDVGCGGPSLESLLKLLGSVVVSCLICIWVDMMVVEHILVHADGFLKNFVAGWASQGRAYFLAVTEICWKNWNLRFVVYFLA